jgi:hypothetical protein
MDVIQTDAMVENEHRWSVGTHSDPEVMSDYIDRAMANPKELYYGDIEFIIDRLEELSKKDPSVLERIVVHPLGHDKGPKTSGIPILLYNIKVALKDENFDGARQQLREYKRRAEYDTEWRGI